MKKFTIFFVLVFFFLVSCKKSNQADCAQPDKISLADATIISKGNLVSTLLPTLNGVVKIYLQKNGRYVLGLEQITLNSNSDLSAYFSTTPAVSSGAIKLFSFKSIDGELFYELPVGINISSYHFLVVQGDILQQPTGFAELE